MGSSVFANNMAVSGKATTGKTICAFPDVCFTPPQTPATPPGVPIPYPNTGMASDTTDGSKKVKIGGKEVGIKDKSCFKKSTGDEAGSAPKKGVITSKNTGKVFFNSWSMDVKIEGENAVRHLDMTTNNHASMTGDTPPWPYIDMVARAKIDNCDDFEDDERQACAGATPHPGGGVNCTPACRDAKACVLKPKREDKEYCCNPNTTGDHLVEVNSFTEVGGRSGISNQTDLKKGELAALPVTLATSTTSTRRPVSEQFASYNDKDAPCVCVGPNHGEQNHHDLQAARDRMKRQAMRRDGGTPMQVFHGGETSHWTYEEAAASGAMAHHRVFPHCNPYCIKQQLDAYHVDRAGIDRKAPVRTTLVID